MLVAFVLGDKIVVLLNGSIDDPEVRRMYWKHFQNYAETFKVITIDLMLNSTITDTPTNMLFFKEWNK